MPSICIPPILSISFEGDHAAVKIYNAITTFTTSFVSFLFDELEMIKQKIVSLLHD